MKKIIVFLVLSLITQHISIVAQNIEPKETDRDTSNLKESSSLERITEGLMQMAEWFDKFMEEEEDISNLKVSLNELFEDLESNGDKTSAQTSSKKNSLLFTLDSDSTLTIQIGGIDRKKDKNLTTSNVVLAFGPTYFIENQTPEEYFPEMAPWSSWSGYTGLNWTSRFGKTSPLGIQYGLVYTWRIMNTNENALLSVQDKTPIYINQSDNQLTFSKSSLRTHYLTVPIHFQITNRKGEGLMASIGGYTGVRLGDTQVLKYKSSIGENIRSKQKYNYRTHPFIYGLSVNVGNENFRGYVNYDLSNVWGESNNYDINRLNFGILFIL